MHIGVDFDNTIADYTGVFHRVALNLGWIPDDTGATKSEVRRYFIEHGIESKWTELQGIVYGKEIMQAKLYPGCLDTLKQLKADGHTLSIISHKTKYPIIGDKVDFHLSALAWLNTHGIIGSADSPVEQHQVYFNQTKDEKVQRIGALKCESFIDDLPDIFTHQDYPSHVQAILFDPSDTLDFAGLRLTHWHELSETL